jgi:flagellar biosynthesis/type III secretory pathway M-ring protein FliF/YscJ
MKQYGAGLGLNVTLGIIGFFLAGGLSLSAGNTMLTSLTRATIGLLAFFFLGYMLRFALHTFVGNGSKSADEIKGKHIDLLLPEQKPTPKQKADKAGEQAENDFVPLGQALKEKQSKLSQTIEEMDPRQMAEAIRHLDD